MIVLRWALLTKVFPAALAADESSPACAPRSGTGTRRADGRARRSAAAVARPPGAPATPPSTRSPGPVLGLLLVCLMLSYSRGSLLALAIGLAVWFAARAAAAAGGRRAGLVRRARHAGRAWAFAQDGLTVDRAPMSARVDAGHELGALLVLLLALLLAAGLAVGYLTSRRPPSGHARGRPAASLLGGLALVPVVVLIALAASPGGIGGQTGDAWNRLVDPAGPHPWQHARPPGRDLFGARSLLAGGAQGPRQLDRSSAPAPAPTRRSATATARTATSRPPRPRLRRADALRSRLGRHRHLAARRAHVGARRRPRRSACAAATAGSRSTPSASACWTMAVIVVIFGAHSAIDWTWFVPGNVVPALLCAGWVAGRGPLRSWLPGAAPVEAPVAEEPSFLARRMPRWSPPPARLGAALLAIAAVLVASWAAYQPVRSVHAGDAALERLESGAYEQASATAQIAVDRNPLSVDPLFELSAIEQARGQTPEAQAALERAVDVQPASAETWRQLGRFRLDVLDEPRKALNDFQTAYYLDPQNPASWTDLILATRAVQADGG